MSDLSAYYDRLAEFQMNERITRRQAGATPRAPRPRGRHALAHRLHTLADRLDT